jgi:hypothetical protein
MDEPKKQSLIPRPHTTGEFIIVVFVGIIAFVTVFLSITAVVLAIFTDKDIGPFFTVLTDLVSTLIAALVGYLAGKSNGNHKAS